VLNEAHAPSGYGSSQIPAPQDPAPMPTCGEVRDQYKEQGCCGAPNKEFHAPGPMRRLQADDGAGAAAERVRAALRRAKAKGGTTEARALARRIGRVLDSYAE